MPPLLQIGSMSISKAHAFTDFLQNYLPDQVQRDLKSGRYKSALSLGCYHSVELQILYHFCDFDYLVGVDQEFESNLAYFATDKFGISDGGGPYKSIYDLYKRGFDPSAGNPTNPKIETQEDYDKIFQVHYGLTQFDYLFNKATIHDNGSYEIEPEFDVIISSNTLHFEKQETNCTTIIEMMGRILKPGGLIYIRVKEFPGEPNRGMATKLSKYSA